MSKKHLELSIINIEEIVYNFIWFLKMKFFIFSLAMLLVSFCNWIFGRKMQLLRVKLNIFLS